MTIIIMAIVREYVFTFFLSVMSKNVKKRGKRCPSFHVSPL